METKKYFFTIDLSLGCDCMGCCMDDSADACVELTDEEADAVRAWTKGKDDIQFNDMEEDLPEIYDKVMEAVYDALWWWCKDDGIANNGYEDYGWDMFEEDVRNGSFVIEGYDPDEDGDLDDNEDIDVDDEYENWCEAKEALEGDEYKDYLEQRYHITESTDFDAIDYVVEIPEELISKED